VNCILTVSRLSISIGLVLAADMLGAQSLPDAVDLDSVAVTGVRASIQQSLLDKHSATGIVDAISAEDIGKFPDLNLSESLQRIPGITLDRNNLGEGATINLRGLGPEFTQVEINGMPGLSNGAEQRTGRTEGSRAFNFEMFASELFSKAVVYKTGLAEVDEGGLAGTVRLQTPRPLDSQGTRVIASLLGNHSDHHDTTDPRAAILFSHNQEGMFGIAASLAWSKTDFASNVVQASSWRPFRLYDNTGISATDPAHAQVRNALIPIEPLYYLFSEERKSMGSTLTLQLRPNDEFNFTVDGLYGKLSNTRLHLRNDLPISTGARAVDKLEIEDGLIVAGDFLGPQHRIGSRHHAIDEDYLQLVARMEWTPDEYWSIRPLLGWARREVERDFALYSFRLADHAGTFDPATVSYRIRGDFIDISSDGTDFYSNPEDFLFNTSILTPSYNRDEEKQARVDIDRHFTGNDHVLKFGLRYNERKMDRTSGQQLLQRGAGTPASALPSLDGIHRLVDFKVRGSTAPSQMLAVDQAKFLQAFMPDGNPRPGMSLVDFPGIAAQGAYTIQEKVASMWMQMEMMFGTWTVIPGIRYAHAEQIASGSDVVNSDLPSQQITPVRVAKTYNSYLPSLSARYDLSEQWVLRAAYARSLTRPNPVNLAPGEVLSGTINGTGRRGNPHLDPYYANNFDMGAEWYFSNEGLLALNLFYKKITNFIDNRTFMAERTFPSQEQEGVFVTSMLTFTEPVNGVSANVKGLEMSAQSRFSSLPGIWGNLGGIINYTHTDSSADYSSVGDIRNQGLPGLSKNSVNAVLYYDDGRFDARLAYAWRDRYMAQFADLGGIPRFTKAYGQVDLSLNWRINPHFSIQAQVLNLTEEQRIDQSSTRYLPYAVSDIDRRFMFGLRVAF